MTITFHIHNIPDDTFLVNAGTQRIAPGFYFSPHDHLAPGRPDFIVAGPFESETAALIACCKQENGDGDKPPIDVALTRGCPSWRSKRKPHSHIAGYVCERKHQLGGYLVIYDATKQDLGGIEDRGGRWVVVWEGCPRAKYDVHGESTASIGPGFGNLRDARSFYRYEADVVQGYDWGGYYSDGSKS